MREVQILLNICKYIILHTFKLIGHRTQNIEIGYGFDSLRWEDGTISHSERSIDQETCLLNATRRASFTL